MKKIFTLFAAAFVALSANAQKITFEDDIKASYSDQGLVLTRVDNNDPAKNKAEDNDVHFGTAEEHAKFTRRLNTGGKSSSNNKMILTIPSAGTLHICARTGSSSATNRTIVLTQNGTELINKILLESEAVKVKGIDHNNPDKETLIYPIISKSVAAGEAELTYPIGGIYIITVR